MFNAFGDGLGHTCLNNSVWVATFANNSANTIQLLWQSEFEGCRQNPVH